MNNIRKFAPHIVVVCGLQMFLSAAPIAGRLETIDSKAGSLTVLTAQGFTTFRFRPSAVVVLNGQPASIEQLAAGMSLAVTSAEPGVASTITATGLPPRQAIPDPAKATGPKSSPPAVALKSKEQVFVNTTWRTPRGTSFHFLPNGKGIRSTGAAQTPFVWDVRSGIVEATGAAATSGNETTWFFRFVSGSEAYYGNTPKGINLKLDNVSIPPK